MPKVKKAMSTVQSSATIKSRISPKSKADFSAPPERTPLDELIVNIFSLKLPESDSRTHRMKVTFCNQTLLNTIIMPSVARDKDDGEVIASGSMSYDPSDYEKMCKFANKPLIIKEQPTSLASRTSGFVSESRMSQRNVFPTDTKDTNQCNIDILPIFIDKDNLCIKKRMQPLIEPPVRERKSWCNLPLLKVEVSVNRQPENRIHHQLLQSANYMKLTLVGAYNMIMLPDEEYSNNVAVTNMPIHDDWKSVSVYFSEGSTQPDRFDPLNFYPKWETLRCSNGNLTEGDEKFSCGLEEITNEGNINLEYYIKQSGSNSTIWGSFHRTLILGATNDWFKNQIREYKWPLEIFIHGMNNTSALVAPLDLFRLLYPGEDTLRLAVPLQWHTPTVMLECGSTPRHSIRSTTSTRTVQKTTNKELPPVIIVDKISRLRGKSSMFGIKIEDDSHKMETGADGKLAFVVLEVKLLHPLSQLNIPPHITEPEINSMLSDLEMVTCNRTSTGRGQREGDWQDTVRLAVNALRRVPYYGTTEFSTFSRQLSKTRTRVEIMTSFCADAATYVNNNFVVQDYLRSEKLFQEMTMVAHACLMRSMHDKLQQVDRSQELDPRLRAARHARQMQDMDHAADLYIEFACIQKRNPEAWRELATCLKDIDTDHARVCLTKAVFLDPQNPLTLLSMGCMMFDEYPEGAEVFFSAILALYPYWSTGWTVVSVYYRELQLYLMADSIMEFVKETQNEGVRHQFAMIPRSWEYELGDWWDSTPLSSDSYCYYDAADLLLRIRAMTLAEACIARGLMQYGESPLYFHLVALSCRLRGAPDVALCHLKTSVKKFGKISYMTSLEAECLLKMDKIDSAMAIFKEEGECVNAYCILQSLPSKELRVKPILVDLLHRQPNAYAWLALAEYWLRRNEPSTAAHILEDEEARSTTCAIACAVQALNVDRRSGHAWAMLAKLVQSRTRRHFCKNMALSCGQWTYFTRLSKEQSLCFRHGKPLRECRCVIKMKAAHEKCAKEQVQNTPQTQ